MDRSPQSDLFSQRIAIAKEPSPVLEMLESIDPDSLAPREALELLYQLKQQLRKDADSD